MNLKRKSEPPRKLKLPRETLRRLEPADLQEARGRGDDAQGCSALGSIHPCGLTLRCEV